MLDAREESGARVLRKQESSVIPAGCTAGSRGLGVGDGAVTLGGTVGHFAWVLGGVMALGKDDDGLGNEDGKVGLEGSDKGAEQGWV